MKLGGIINRGYQYCHLATLVNTFINNPEKAWHDDINSLILW